MSKDKIIKDLKKRNDSIKIQYEYRNIRCVHLEKENERLQQENQQLKKQKDDVVEYCKKAIESLNWKKRDIMQILTPENGYLKIDIEIEINKYKELLRMLGEIDDNKGNDE